jgi:uncharacterized membrane protein YqjE
VSAALVIASLMVLLRFVLVSVVVAVALKTDDRARRQTAITVLRVLRPFASLPETLSRR